MIRYMKNNFDTFIIDTGGQDSKEMRKAIISSNIIIPTVPSQYDGNVLDYMLDNYAEDKDLNTKLVALVLANHISKSFFTKRTD